MTAGDTEAAETVQVDQVLVAAGRTPNVESLGLEAAGVAYGRRGVEVNDHLQTSQPHIYAAGDVVGPYQFTHVADMHARVVVRNILLPIRKVRVDYRVVPRAVFTEPTLASVGVTEREARAAGREVKTGNALFASSGRAKAIGQTEGLVKLIADAESGELLGGHILGPHADNCTRCHSWSALALASATICPLVCSASRRASSSSSRISSAAPESFSSYWAISLRASSPAFSAALMLSAIRCSRASRATQIGPQANFQSTANSNAKTTAVKIARSGSNDSGFDAEGCSAPVSASTAQAGPTATQNISAQPNKLTMVFR